MYRPSRIKTALSIVLIACVATTGVAGVAVADQGSHATGVTSTDESGQTSVDRDASSSTDSVSFGSPPSQGRGDIATINLNMDGIETATVKIGGTEVNYYALVTVRDGDDDGEATIAFNTYTAGTSDDGYTVVEAGDSGDSIQSVEEGESFTDQISSPDKRTIDAGDYELRAWDGSTSDGDPSDTNSLNLEAASLEAISTAHAPRGMAFSSANGVLSAYANGSVTNDDDIPAGNVLVHEVKIAGLEGVLESKHNQGAMDDTEAFLSLLESHDSVELDIAVDGTALSLESDTLQFVSDPSNDTYYIVYDTADQSAVTVGSAASTEFSWHFSSASVSESWEVVEPASTPTPTATATPNPTPTASPTAMAAPNPTPTASPTATVTSESIGQTDESATQTSTALEDSSTASPATTDRDGESSTDASGPGFTSLTAFLALASLVLWIGSGQGGDRT